MIEIINLHKAFGHNQVLKGIDLSFKEGGICAILGPNSSGKTTLIKSLLGMVRPQKGNIVFRGQDIKTSCHYREQIGYLPQIARFPENLTVNELLSMIRDIRNCPTNDTNLIELFELEPFLDKRLGKLSGGTRQKVNIVQAFMYDSPCLILDEPTAGLDPVSTIKLKGLLKDRRAQGRLILITTHIMTLVEEIADELIFLLEGKIRYQGSPDRLKSDYGANNLERAIAAMISGDEKLISKIPGHRQSDDVGIEVIPQNR